MGCRAAMCGLEPRPEMSSAIGASSISTKMERWPGERFEELVVQALDSIPNELAGYIENVTVVVQGWPTAGQQVGHRGILLGLYEGVSLTRREPLCFSAVMPDRITIFEEPKRRITQSEEASEAASSWPPLTRVGTISGSPMTGCGN